jgi:general secretion pathway protein D
MTTRRLVPAFAGLALLLLLGPVRGDEFNWDGGSATLEDLLKYVKGETGKRFIYDPAILKDKRVTILAPDFHKENLLSVFEAVLEMQGLGLAASGDEQGEIFKIVKSESLKSQPLPLFTQEDLGKLPASDRLITQVLTLKHIDPAQVGPILNDLMHIPTGSIRPIPNSNVVVITEYASNMRRLAKIIEVMDRENAPPEVRLFPLRHATSSELAPRLNSILSSLTAGRRAGGMGGQPLMVSVLEDTRTNALLVIGYVNDLKTAEDLIGKLDIDLGADQNTIQFFPLRHRNAKELVDIIKAMYAEVQDAQRGGQAAPNAPPRPQPPAGFPPAVAGNLPAGGDAGSSQIILPRIVADEGSNAIIAIGPPRSFQALKATIDRLDTRRPQVFIEATIMEVGDNASRQLGIQLASVEQPNGSKIPFGGTNFGFTTPDAADPLSATINPAQGLLAGVFKDSTRKIPLILRALETTNDAEVIATPSLMTNDNQKASVVISEGQPTTTTSTGTATTNTTFAGFQNADTKLEITPHISVETEGEKRQAYLRLEITQTLEKFVGASSSAGIPPPKESRTTTTTVTIPDGATVVISWFTRKDRRTTV